MPGEREVRSVEELGRAIQAFLTDPDHV
jgi:hypothetical protein